MRTHLEDDVEAGEAGEDGRLRDARQDAVKAEPVEGEQYAEHQVDARQQARRHQLGELCAEPDAM